MEALSKEKDEQHPALRLANARAVSLASEETVRGGFLIRLVFELMGAMVSVFDPDAKYKSQKVVGLLLWAGLLAGFVWLVFAAIGRGEACDVCRIFGI